MKQEGFARKFVPAQGTEVPESRRLLKGMESVMSQNRRNYRQATYEKNRSANTGRNRDVYVYGNTVRKIDVEREWETAPQRQVQPSVRKNRDKARHMSAGYVIFLAVAMCAAALILVNYIQLQAELTNRTRSVASKQSELNDLKVANDEEYNRILSSIDLEEIKRIAIGELGMTYAQEGQIVLYSNEGSDYMRKVPESN